MIYYLLLKNDTEKDVYFDSNVLGEESFGKFYPERGLEALMNIKDKSPSLLESVIIKKETGEVISLIDFLNILDELRIQKNA
jgi:hypothetical protein